MIMSAGMVGPILFILILILGGSAFGASHISPNKKAYWVLITIYLVSGFRSVFQYCSAGPIPDDPSIITIQLPCWAYALIFLLQIASIVLVGIFHEKTSADDAKKLESVSKKASLTTKEKERIQKLAIGALEEWAELAEQKEDNNIQKNQ